MNKAIKFSTYLRIASGACVVLGILAACLSKLPRGAILTMAAFQLQFFAVIFYLTRKR
jgi:hypothetical protein